jgi:nucleoside-diphosphate-sugar epimerase
MRKKGKTVEVEKNRRAICALHFLLLLSNTLLNMPPRPGTVVVTGGTGYLGQWVVAELLDAGWARVAIFYHAADTGTPPAWPDEKDAARVSAHPVDLATGAGLAEAFEDITGQPGGGLAGVVNCAAVSSPAACEADPAGAAAVNVPTALLAALRAACRDTRPVFVQLSTDQCYGGEGTPAGGWAEGDALAPVNAYARTKAEAEAAVRAAWPENALILRCSVMVGALPPAWPLSPGRLPFLQFAAAAVKKAPAAAGGNDGPSFFVDEWRSFVGVRDVARVCAAAVLHRPPVPVGSTAVSTEERPTVVNVGGPARLSRADFARSVAAAVGAPASAVVESRASEAVRAVASPADIAMDISLLRSGLGFEPRSVEAVIAEEL